MEIALNFIAQYGYIALFFIMLLAGTYLPIPAGLILVVVGTAFHGQPLHLIIAFFVATFASLVDDLIIYAIARKLGKKEGYERFVAKNKLAQKLEAFTVRHPRLAIFSSRFVGFIRVPVSALSGLTGVHMRTFIPFVTLGSMICVAAYLGVGYSLGYIWDTDARTAGTVVGAIFLVIGALALLWYSFNRWRTRRRLRLAYDAQASSSTG